MPKKPKATMRPKAKKLETITVYIPELQFVIASFKRVQAKPYGNDKHLAYVDFKDSRGRQRMVIRKGQQYFMTMAEATKHVKAFNRIFHKAFNSVRDVTELAVDKA